MSKFISLTGLSEFLTKCRALFYTKPNSGIPASDLASSVQTSLGKADSAYQKPSGGIPALDIASGVIPTVPTISTNISTDATSDTKTASPKAIKTYVDGSLSPLEAEVEAINRGEYVVAWDGTSAPVVANIPAGVSVTYNSTSYTGTLSASDTTIGKIYLVSTGTTDEYNRYVTSRSGSVGSYTYSWVALGSASIQLRDYATKAEFSQLGQELKGKIVIPTKYTNGYIKTSDAPGTAINLDSPVMLSPWMCYVGECKEGDTAIVSGTGGLSPRLWAFLDADYKILTQSAASVSATNLEITAPSNAAWVIVNDNSGKTSYLSAVESITDNAMAIREQKSEIDNLNGMLYHDTDIEGRLEITLDENDRIVSYRKPDGTKVENIGVESRDIKTKTLSVDNIEISRDGVNGLILELKDAGFTGGSGDWSDASKLAIPTPRCAVINLTSSDGTPATWPVTKTSDFEYWMQFWDMQGNYFKKRVIFNAQGNSSMAMPKKNGAIDLCNDEWEGDDTFEVKFGDWIPQDSFHLKAYYADYFVGVAVVGYEIFDQMTKTRDIYSQRDWIKYLLPSKETIGVDSQATDGLSDNLTMHNDAKCFPDGFPVLVYLDGVFYGVYSWQLKKHRDNYQMNKSNANEIHLDGMISSDSIFEADGNLPWGVINGTTEAPSGGYDGFEVRNPKSLICVDGTKYDADTNRKELISATSPGYDPANANMVRTAQVRAAMEQLSTYIPALHTMESGGSTTEQIRAKIEDCFDVEALIDYIIFGDTLGNTDGYRKNWQWMTWDGNIWVAEPYDLDALLGWSGWTNISPVLANHYGNSKSVPTGWVIAYYADEMELRYKQLRDSGILTKENIARHLQEWVYRIGTKNFSKNHELWPYDREHYEVAPENTRVDSIFRVSNWIEQRISYCDALYNY